MRSFTITYEHTLKKKGSTTSKLIIDNKQNLIIILLNLIKIFLFIPAASKRNQNTNKFI